MLISCPNLSVLVTPLVAEAALRFTHGMTPEGKLPNVRVDGAIPKQVDYLPRHGQDAFCSLYLRPTSD